MCIMETWKRFANNVKKLMRNLINSLKNNGKRAYFVLKNVPIKVLNYHLLKLSVRYAERENIKRDGVIVNIDFVLKNVLVLHHLKSPIREIELVAKILRGKVGLEEMSNNINIY